MIDLYNNIEFYLKNTVRSLDNFNILNNATVISDETASSILILSGGLAGYTFSNQYNNGLKASNYRRLYLKLNPTPSVTNPKQISDYENILEVTLTGVYYDNKQVKQYLYISINLTRQDIVYSSGEYYISRIIQLDNIPFESLQIAIQNHSTASITLKECSLYRSQDISTSQVGESIGFGITLNKVIAYLDGCEIYYDGIEQPDKLWYLEDNDGNFAGVNVNNERRINFSRVNEVLLD